MGERSKSLIKYSEIYPRIRYLKYGIARIIKHFALMSCRKDTHIALDAMCIPVKTSIALISNMTVTAKQFPAAIAYGAWDSSNAWGKKMNLDSSTIAAMVSRVLTSLSILPLVCLHRHNPSNIDSRLLIQ